MKDQGVIIEIAKESQEAGFVEQRHSRLAHHLCRHWANCEYRTAIEGGREQLENEEVFLAKYTGWAVGCQTEQTNREFFAKQKISLLCQRETQSEFPHDYGRWRRHRQGCRAYHQVPGRGSPAVSSFSEVKSSGISRRARNWRNNPFDG